MYHLSLLQTELTKTPYFDLQPEGRGRDQSLKYWFRKEGLLSTYRNTTFWTLLISVRAKAEIKTASAPHSHILLPVISVQ